MTATSEISHGTYERGPTASLVRPAGAPRRFMLSPDWARDAGAPMRRLISGDADPTQEELDLIARSLLARDEPGARLAAAVVAKTVTLKQFRQALTGGITTVPDAPAALMDFFAQVESRPDWVDDDDLCRGARVLRRCGTNTLDVLAGALLAGYRSSADTGLLVQTGGLAGDGAARRLGETAKWQVECIREGGLDRDRDGWRLTVHVRLMHALVNQRFDSSDSWDQSDWGKPINQADQAGTLGLHCTYLLIGLRMLGMPISKDEGRAVMHLWRYIGWLMGVNEEWLPTSEQDGRRKFYVLGLTTPGPDANSVTLAAAFDASFSSLSFSSFPALRRRYERAKLRSASRVLVGRDGMTDIGLKAGFPWYHLARGPFNLVTHLIALRTSKGEQWLVARGERQLRASLSKYFGAATPEVGKHRYVDA